MDAVNDPSIHTIVVKKSAQVGWTEILNNTIGYFMEHDPCPVLLVQPTLEIAEAWSKDRLAPMLRDTPALRGLVSDARSRDSGNTLLHKTFPGGHLTMAGANSPSSLASRPIRIVLCDEVDRYPASAGAEGDPVSLARKRSTTYWNRKLLMGSTPTDEHSRIDAAHKGSDQRKFYVPCPHCEERQTLKWAQVQWPENEPQSAYYVCEYCGAVIEDNDKPWMLANGEWIAENVAPGIAGFEINEIYSPWVTFGEMAVAFLEAKKLPETLKTWVNTALGQTWEEEGESAKSHDLLARVENYGPLIPMGGLALFAGVDVQDNRVEIDVTAYGLDYESWGIEYQVLYGDPAGDQLWKDLDAYLLSTFEHESGLQMRISAAGVDTGGHHTQQAYKFCRPRFRRGIFALKGAAGRGKPLIGRPSKSNAGKVNLYTVGVDTAKELLYGRLRITEPGPGYCHFPAHYDEDYFKGLTAEKLITKYVKGRATRAWVKKREHQPNEPLDTKIYGMAVMELKNPNFQLLAQQIGERVKQIENNAGESSGAVTRPRQRRKRRMASKGVR